MESSSKSFNLAAVLAVVGATVLLTSLFIPWFEPGFSAWSVFEVLDLLLAALSLGVVSAVASDRGGQSPLGRRSLPLLGPLALVIVISQLIDHPPAVTHNDLAEGSWVGLLGALMMTAGGLVAVVGRLLVERIADRVVSPPSAGSRLGTSVSATEPRPPDEAIAAESEVHQGLYPAGERRGPIGADDPELATPIPEAERLESEGEHEEPRVP